MQDYDVVYTEHAAGTIQQLSVEFARAVRSWSLSRYAGAGLDANALTQIYRAGTSVGANIREAQYAESRKDFIHKLKIAEKELGEFFYWLGVINSSQRQSEDEATKSLVKLAQQVRRLLIAIIVKAKKNLQTPP